MIIPDCTYCGKQVVIDFDIEDDRRARPVEVCTGCGVGQRVLQMLQPAEVARIRREIREAYQEVQERKRSADGVTEAWRRERERIEREGAA